MLCGIPNRCKQTNKAGQASRPREAPWPIAAEEETPAKPFHAYHSLTFPRARLRGCSAGDSAHFTGERPRASGVTGGTESDETGCAKVAERALGAGWAK